MTRNGRSDSARISQAWPMVRMGQDRLVGWSRWPPGSQETVSEFGTPPTSRTVSSRCSAPKPNRRRLTPDRALQRWIDAHITWLDSRPASSRASKAWLFLEGNSLVGRLIVALHAPLESPRLLPSTTTSSTRHPPHRMGVGSVADRDRRQWPGGGGTDFRCC